MRRRFRDPARDKYVLFDFENDADNSENEGDEEFSGELSVAKGPDKAQPRSVSEITRAIKNTLESGFSRVWVEGEISNFSAPRSGHLYFTLKDENSSIPCVMWRSSASKVARLPEDGARVTVRGKLAVYEPQGKYQIVCDSLKVAGTGDLLEKFEELKRKLQAEGLFDFSRKKDLPEFPRTVGIVTSPTGAAIRDMLRILRRRMPSLKIIISPSKVQGEGAAKEAAEALSMLDQSGLCDVIIIGRGGGSLEDLWAFNEEILARAVAACNTPIVSAVGHETDFSLTDFTADYRAATPSEAAEAVAPEQRELLEILQGQLMRLSRALYGKLELEHGRIRAIATRPVIKNPANIYERRLQDIDYLSEALDGAAKDLINNCKHQLGLQAAKLQALSPLKVMARGYSIAKIPQKERLVHSVREVKIDDTLETLLPDGTITSRVIDITPAPEKTNG